MRWLLSLLATAAIVTPVTAYACRGVHSHRYVVSQNPPSRLPAGAVLLRVRIAGELPYGGDAATRGAMARVLSGPNAGRMIQLKPTLWTSCSAWFEGKRTGYVVGYRDGTNTLVAIEYRSRQYRTPDEEWSRDYEKPEAQQ